MKTITVESATYANGALLLVCRRVKREAGDARDHISCQSGAAPAAVSLTNLFKRHCAKHGKARTEEDEGEPEYRPGALNDGAKPGEWFCPFDFGTY